MNVVILNGASSVGKTSVGKSLQDIMNEHYLLLGLDNIIYTMPERINDYKADMLPRDGFFWLAETDKNGKSLMHLTAGSYAQRIYKMLIKQVKFFADSGFNIIVDHLSLINDYEIWNKELIDHDIVFCGLTASQEILDQREKARGDRVIGGSRAQMLNVHDGYNYDIFIDTSHTEPLKTAKEISKVVYKKFK